MDQRVEVVDDINEDKIESTPYVGMLFKSSDEAYLFYNNYAFRIGFGTTKRDKKFREDGRPERVTFACCKQGRPRSKIEDTPYRRRPTAKTNCPARMVLVFQPDGLFHVTKLILEHNHEVNPSMSRFMPSHRKLGPRMKKILERHNESGLPPNKTFQSLVTRGGGGGGGYEKLPFLAEDCRNRLEKVGWLKLGEGDAEAILQYFRRQQKQNPNFFHSIDLDEDGRLRNVFWADARSRASYQYFNEVMAFDTFYMTNKYDIPFAPFIGVNHHGNSILLGAGLLADETTETYAWLFETWLSCMHDIAPRAILTDQCKAIGNAVAMVFPETRHRLCIWHIKKKIPDKLGSHKQFHSILQRFNQVVHESLTVYTFEEGWKEMVEKFELENNLWLISLFNDRHLWVPVFLKDMFWAGMSSTRRSEEMNSFFDEYITSKTSLKQFLQQYEIALRSKYEKEAEEDYQSCHFTPHLLTHFKMEEQLAGVYTINIFRKFQSELIQMANCNTSLILQNGPISKFEVTEYLRDREVAYEVNYNADLMEADCICRHFEFSGLLCRHALCVLKLKRVQEIPQKYILDRWRKDSKRIRSLKVCKMIVPDDNLERYDELYTHCNQRLLEIVDIGALTKERYGFVVKVMNEFRDKVRKYDEMCEKKRLNKWEEEIRNDLIVAGERAGRSGCKSGSFGGEEEMSEEITEK